MNNCFNHNLMFSPIEIENKESTISDGIKKSCEKIINIEIINNITLEQAREIQEWIIEENQEHKHMIEKSVEQIKNEINSGLGFVALINGELSGCITMIKMKTVSGIEIFEVGSLITSKNKRGLGIAKKLTTEIFEKNKDKNLYSITEVEGVKHIYKDYLSLVKISKDQLNKEILDKIEEVGELLETDEIYANNNFINNSI